MNLLSIYYDLFNYMLVLKDILYIVFISKIYILLNIQKFIIYNIIEKRKEKNFA